MSFFQTWGLKKRVVACLLAFGLLPALTLYTLFYVQEEAIKKSFDEPLRSQSKTVIEAIDRTLYERLGDVGAFSLNNAMKNPNDWQGPSSAYVQDTLNGYMDIYAFYDLMMIVDMTGHVRMTNTLDTNRKPVKGPSLVGQSFAQEDWFKRLGSGQYLKDKDGKSLNKLLVGPIPFPMLNNQRAKPDSYVMIFAAPIVDAQNQTIGFWVNVADASFLSRILAKFHHMATEVGQDQTDYTLLDKDGFIILEHDSDKNDQQNLARDFSVYGKRNLVQTGSELAKVAVSGKNEVLSAYNGRKKVVQIGGVAHAQGYDDFQGLGWSIMVRSEAEDLHAIVTKTNHHMIIAIGIALLIILGSGIFLGDKFSTPISTLADIMRRVASGHKDLEIPYQDNKTEFGEMAQSCNFFKQAVEKSERLSSEQKFQAERTEYELKQKMLLLTDEIEKEMQETIAGVLENAQGVLKISKDMTASATRVALDSTAVSQATERAQMNVESVAAATEELSISVNEISQQVTHAAQTAQTAVTTAHSTNLTVQELADAVRSVGDVILLISSIAEQTNLLALNATIEAARAGESGKGFAVVAAEVKNLANQTTKATDGITQQITAIQTATDNAVNAIEDIVRTIQEIDNISSSIAAAVEEQGAATNEISANTQQAAFGTKEVSEKISGVNAEFQTTSMLSTKVKETTDSVMDLIQDLKNRMVVILRDSYAGNRRQNPRYKTENYVASLIKDGKNYPCDVKDISCEGLAVSSNDLAQSSKEGDLITIELSGYMQNLSGHIVGIAGGQVVRVVFKGDERQKQSIERYLEVRFGKQAAIA